MTSDGHRVPCSYCGKQSCTCDLADLVPPPVPVDGTATAAVESAATLVELQERIAELEAAVHQLTGAQFWFIEAARYASKVLFEATAKRGENTLTWHRLANVASNAAKLASSSLPKAKPPPTEE